jgi:hypothetical protein
MGVYGLRTGGDGSQSASGMKMGSVDEGGRSETKRLLFEYMHSLRLSSALKLRWKRVAPVLFAS